jgi:hypothetical protein
VPGNEGRCLPIASGMDPDDECPGAATCNGSAACTIAPDMGTIAPDMGTTAMDGGGMGGDGAMSVDAQPDLGVTHEMAGCCGVAGAGGESGPLAAFAAIVTIVLVRRRRGAR